MKIIHESQHGFVADKVVGTDLFAFIKAFVSTLDQRELIAAFFIELSYGFDSHNRRIFYEKLH